MAQHGGKRAPDGRPSVVPGVGKTARRHDLEAPATPGLSGTDLQSGDVQALEQAQQIAPRPKRPKPLASRRVTPRGVQSGDRAKVTESGEIPDPVEMAGRKIGGSVVGDDSLVEEPFDLEKWRPLLQEIARNPNLSGPLTSTLMRQLQNIAQIPNTASVHVIDQNAMDVALRERR